MKGIDLNKPIKYIGASFRYFKQGEKHISRVCSCDVLVLVFDGVLRFTENGERLEVKAGEYYIQKHGSVHTAEIASDCPQYLWVHFLADWNDNEDVLPYHGTYNYQALKPFMEEMDNASYSGAKLVYKNAALNRIFSLLEKIKGKSSRLDGIIEYISKYYFDKISLQSLSTKFNYSKNQIINLFKQEYQTTPMSYLLKIRMENAKRLLINSSKSADEIAYLCGFSDYSHLYKKFMQTYGCSPKEWRKNNQFM